MKDLSNAPKRKSASLTNNHYYNNNYYYAFHNHCCQMTKHQSMALSNCELGQGPYKIHINHLIGISNSYSPCYKQAL